MKLIILYSDKIRPMTPLIATLIIWIILDSIVTSEFERLLIAIKYSAILSIVANTFSQIDDN
jgi:hypothetical protein